MRPVLALACLVGCDKVYGLHRDPEPIDAAIDVPSDVFDRSQCPDSYVLSPPNIPVAYRIIEAPADAAQQLQACDGDAPGWTHLARLASDREATYLAAHLHDSALGPAWIGAVQPRMSGSPTAGWITTDGTPLLETLWAANEPNDFDGTENGDENYVRLDPDRQFLVDIASFVASPAICECDGHGSDPAFVDIYTQ